MIKGFPWDETPHVPRPPFAFTRTDTFWLAKSLLSLTVRALQNIIIWPFRVVVVPIWVEIIVAVVILCEYLTLSTSVYLRRRARRHAAHEIMHGKRRIH